MTTISASSTIGIYLVSPSFTNPLVINPGVTISTGGNAIYGFTGAWTIQNSGGILSALGNGVYLGAGGAVTNAAAASISGVDGVNIAGGTGTVVNNGRITGDTTSSIGVLLAAGGGVSNQSGATISGYTGVDLTAGGSVTNASGASITGVYAAVQVFGGAGTVVNAGGIAGTGAAAIGIVLGSGGSITNAAAASIKGEAFGVDLSAGGTLTNAGTVVGSYGTAVYFGGTGGNRLVLDPGYGLSGKAIGGPSATNTLELASATSAGTLSGLGGEFVNFGQTTIDAGASWVLNGANTIAAGTTLTELSGATLTVSGTLADAGALNGSGVVTIGAGGTLQVQGTVAAGEMLINAGTLEFQSAAAANMTFSGAGGVLALDDPAGYGGTIANFLPGDTIDLTSLPFGTANTGTLQSGNTLQIVENATTVALQLDPAQSFSGVTFALSPHPITAATDVTVTSPAGPPSVTEALAKDTGSSSTDKITNNGALTGGGGGNAVVTLTEGSTTLGTTTANASGVWTFTPASLPQGVNTVVASETVAGSTGSASLTFTYDTVAPAVTEALVSDTGSSSTDKITNNAALTGGGDPNAVVTLKKGGSTLGTATANAGGTWNFTPVSLAQGANTIVASETDLAGNKGSASLTFTYDTTPPAVTEALVSDTGSSSTDKITNNDALTGGGDPNAVVTLTETGTTIGTATANAAGVWNFTPASLAQGANSIVASETDLAGNTGSASLTFTYDTVAPVVTEALVSNTGGSSTSNDALTGTGDPNVVVTLTEGATTLGTATANASGVWNFTPAALPQGANTIVASETDLAGNTGSASLTFTYDTVAPVVTEALVSDTGSSSTDKITSNDALTGGGAANAMVTLTEASTTLGTATANASGVWSFTPASPAQGVNTIVASETVAGNTGSASLTFTYDTVAPAVTEALVSDTGSSSADKITNNDALTGGGATNAVVTLTEASTTLGTTTANAAGTWSFTPGSLAQGVNTIVASETDLAGNTGSASLTFTYDTVAPVVTEALVSNTGGSSTSNDALTGTGDRNVVVTLTEGATTLGTATANASGVWNFTPAALPQGANTIVASETDLAGNTGSASLTFTYDTVAPVVTEALVSNTGGSSTSNDALTGTGDPNVVVTLTEGATTLGTATANASGVWNFTPAALPQGANTIVAGETDLAGNTGSASLTFTYDTVAPVVTEALVSDTGSSSTDKITSNDALTGGGAANAMVTLTEASTTLGTATANASGVWSFTPASPAQGVNTIVASETVAGNTGSASLTFTYDTVAPAVTEALVSDTGSSSTDKITSNDALTGGGAANAMVTLTEASTTLGITTANASGVWSFTPGSPAQGVNTIVTSETDLAGNTGSASLTFTYDTVAPVVTEALVSNTGGSSTSNDALTGTGDPNVVVTLTEGATTLGTATANASGVWNFTPAALPQGANTIVASETDLAGNTGSASLTFTYDTVAPVVTEALVSNTGGSSTSNDALTGTGDPNVVVTLTEGATTLGTATANASGVWNFTPAALPQGANTIVAGETDLAGNTGSASLTFTYDTVAPVVTEALVSDTGSSSTDKITSNDALTGGGAANAMVTLTEASTTLGTATANASGVWSFTPASPAQGVNTIVASETVAGNTGSASLTFTYDTVAPAVTEALVSDTGSSSTDKITSNDALTGGGAANAMVTLTEASTTLGITTANASGVWSFTPGSPAQGVNTIVTSETDLAGNTGSASLTFTYDTVAPVVTEALVSNTGGSSTSNDALTGTGDPNVVVTLTEGATTLGTATANASGVWNFTPAALPQGANTIVASETDLAGNTGSASLTFTYDTVAPAVTEALVSDTGSSSTDKITSNDALTGGGAANAMVTLTEASTTLGTATANASGVWSFTPASLAQGVNTIVASETVAGNTGSASLTFTYDDDPRIQGPTPSTASLSKLEGSGSSLTSKTPIATFNVSGGLPNDAYSFALSGPGAQYFTIKTSAGTGTLSTGGASVPAANHGAARLYALYVQATDTTSGAASASIPLDIGVISANAGTINLTSGTNNLGIVATTATFISPLGNNETLNAAGMTAQVWIDAGPGDIMTGGTGANDYLYGATSDSTRTSMDVITNFNALTNIIDLTGLGTRLNVAGAVSKSLAAHSVGWQTVGTGSSVNTFVFVNTSGSSENLTATNMKIELKGSIALSGSNIVHL